MNTSTIHRNAVDYFYLTRLQRHNIIVYIVLKRLSLYFNRVSEIPQCFVIFDFKQYNCLQHYIHAYNKKIFRVIVKII